MISLTVGTLRKSPSTGRRPSSCLITKLPRGDLAAAVSLLRAEFEVGVYEQSPELNQVGGDIRGGVP